MIDIIPMADLKNNALINTHNTCTYITNRLLKRFRSSQNSTYKNKIELLNREIKDMIFSNKKKQVRKNIVPGNSKSLWNAVKIAKDINVSPIPQFKDGQKIDTDELPDAFLNYFKSKVDQITQESNIDPNVYNGRQKINAGNFNFMNQINVMEAIQSIKFKNTEGYDPIPQRILVDGINFLLNPISKLFKLIYEQKTIPEQWLVSKIIPI